MKYKIVTLNKDVDCSEIKYPDTPSLLFGILPSNKLPVFDATKYCNDKNINFDLQTFTNLNGIYIDRLISDNTINSSGFLFVTPKQHLLMANGLELIFLAYADSNMFSYFLQTLEDALKDGIAISDSRITQLIVERVPNEVLNDIILTRNESEEK